MSDIEKPTVKIGRYLYLGAYKYWSDKEPQLRWRIYRLYDTPNDGSPLNYNTANVSGYTNKTDMFPHIRVGGVFEMEYTDNEGRTITPTSARFIEQWGNKEDVINFQAQSRVVELEFKLLRKQEKNKLDTSGLAPYHSAYMNLDRTQKTLFLSEIIRFITMGS